MGTYRDLLAWQRAMDLAVEAYAITALLPASERFGLVFQIRKAAVSVASNIAEGHGRLHQAEFVNFLSISSGSLKEVEALIRALRRRGK